MREGSGFGQAKSAAPGPAHEIALKTAETDATKRALTTFGSPFGLDLYRKPSTAREPEGFACAATPLDSAQAASSDTAAADLIDDVDSSAVNIADGVQSYGPGLRPDDLTPVPRPSRYFGAEGFHATRKENGRLVREAASQAARAARRRAVVAGSETLLPFGKVKRIRDKAHLAFVRSQPCLVCGRNPADPHHLRFAQPWGFGLKVGDEFTVPLCRSHHRELHRKGNEVNWWAGYGIDPLATAKALWASRRSPPLQPVSVDDTVQQKAADSQNKGLGAPDGVAKPTAQKRRRRCPRVGVSAVRSGGHCPGAVNGRCRLPL